MDFIRFFLILIVPGIIAARAFGIIGCVREEPRLTTALIFDLLIFIINITGLYFFKGIYTMSSLLLNFECLSFTRRYALLSIFIGLILAILFGLLVRPLRFFRILR